MKTKQRPQPVCESRRFNDTTQDLLGGKARNWEVGELSAASTIRSGPRDQSI